MTEPRVRVGLIGCGNISGRYLTNVRRFDTIDVIACADALPERARSTAADFGIRTWGTVDSLLDNDAVELILNLTPPPAHATIAHAAIAAQKSVYNEKPLAITREDGQQLLAAAATHGVRIGAAPDTFLGAGLQTCREVIDSGAIGEPVAATAFMLNHGHEHWHPDPAFYYQPGGGPLLDMGPYYLTALITLLGPVRRVTGSARASFPERTITSAPKAGTTIPVAVPTHVAAVLDFVSGAIATVVTSFDVWGSDAPKLEIHGAAGSLALPDPNRFDGPVRLWRAGAEGWDAIALTRPYVDESRGLGLADMAMALRTGRPHRASGELAHHVLDVMTAITEASRSNRHIAIASRRERPAPLPPGLADGEIDP